MDENNRDLSVRFHVKHAPSFMQEFEGEFQLDTKPYHVKSLITYWMTSENLTDFIEWADDLGAVYSLMRTRRSEHPTIQG